MKEWSRDSGLPHQVSQSYFVTNSWHKNNNMNKEQMQRKFRTSNIFFIVFGLFRLLETGITSSF